MHLTTLTGWRGDNVAVAGDSVETESRRNPVWVDIIDRFSHWKSQRTCHQTKQHAHLSAELMRTASILRSFQISGLTS